ncbi:MAG: hypothetical protein ACOH2N_11290 [Devosia sp.]
MRAVRTFLMVFFVLATGSVASAEDLLGGELDKFVTDFNGASSILGGDVLMATTKCGEGAKVRTCQILSPGKVAGLLIAGEDRETLRSVMLFMAGGTDATEFGEAINATLLMYAGDSTPQDHAGALRVLIAGIIAMDEETVVLLNKTEWRLIYGEATGYILSISST